MSRADNDYQIMLRYTPRRHPLKHISPPNVIRVFRANTDGDINIQIRRENEYTMATLTEGESREVMMALQSILTFNADERARAEEAA